MKFSIDRDAFSELLARIQGVCSGKTTLAILASCMIEARENSITVLGTDLDLAIRSTCDAKVEEEGRIVLGAKRLFETVKSLQSGPLSISLEGNQAILESGRFKGRLMCSSVDDFPSLPTMNADDNLSIDASVLSNMISKTIFSISTDETRVDFNGAFFVLHKDGRVQMVSTDGHRLSRVENKMNVTNDVPEALEKGVIIPRKGLIEINRVMEGGELKLGIEKERLIVLSPKISLSIQLIPGQFPDFTKVIPKFLDHKALVDRSSFSQVLKRASNYTAKVGTIRLSLSPGQLEIHAFDSEAGEVHDAIECEYDGSGVTVGFNWKYIEEVLRVIDGDRVSIEIIDTDNPSLIRDLDNKKMDFIVMPMQL
ncbi:MAG: DNA polymerase III subunit beta [Bradymonadia bacterium]|jgi:DNA polymerase-3 subunit beta